MAGKLDYFITVVVAGSVCFLVLLIMSSAHEVSLAEETPEVLVRKVSHVPPPPPPPKEIFKKVMQKPIDVSMMTPKSSQSPVILETAPLDLQYDVDLKPVVKLSNDYQFNVEVDVEIAQALQTHFNFEALSEGPRPLGSGGFKYAFPTLLRKRGIKEGKVVVLIEINTKGRASVLQVQTYTHKSLVPIAKRYVKMTPFTIPTVDGRAVTAKGIWPVILRAPKR